MNFRQTINPILVVIAYFLVPVTGAGAFVINVNSQDLATNQPNEVICNLTETVASSASCVSGLTDVISGGDVVATGFGSGSGNIVTGELKAKASGSADTAFAEESISATGQAEIGESFIVSGNGTITAFLGLTGEWDVFKLNGNTPGFQAQAKLIIHDGATENSPIEGQDSFSVNQGDGTFSGSVDDVLSVAFDVSDGDTFFVEASLLAQISNGQGVVDFSNTGALLLTPSDNVSIAFGNPLFLEDPAFGATGTVPEPSTLAILAAGLFGLGVARSSRRGAARE